MSPVPLPWSRQRDGRRRHRCTYGESWRLYGFSLSLGPAMVDTARIPRMGERTAEFRKGYGSCQCGCGGWVDTTDSSGLFMRFIQDDDAVAVSSRRWEILSSLARRLPSGGGTPGGGLSLPVRHRLRERQMPAGLRIEFMRSTGLRMMVLRSAPCSTVSDTSASGRARSHSFL